MMTRNGQKKELLVKLELPAFRIYGTFCTRNLTRDTARQISIEIEQELKTRTERKSTTAIVVSS